MAKPSPSYDPFGFTKMWTEFDPTKLLGEFAKAFGAYEAGGVDVNAILESQRKNVEALNAANQRALEGVQAIANRQREILEQTMNEASAALKTLSTAGSPQDATAKQAELLKTAFEKALANMRELADTMTKANTEAFDTINKRISESLDEIKELALKARK